MSAPTEAAVPPTEETPAPSNERRADVDAKHAQVAALLKELQCEGLLVLEPENVAWLTGGLTARGIQGTDEQPALWYTPEQRWLIAANVDSQRLFDEEIDGLGFQLKEWPWHWGRKQLLTDLCTGRHVAADRLLGDVVDAGERLRQLRRALTPFEITAYRELGRLVSHALEATCRTLTVGLTEQEIAGHVGHRLLHRGAEPLAIGVAADGRSRRYRRCGATSAPVQRYCVLQATGRQAGLVAMASRTVCFEPLDEELRREHDTVCKVSAAYITGSWPNGIPKELLAAGRRIYQICGAEHEWRLTPAGEITGRTVVESALLPHTADLLQPGWAVTWRASAGAALSCDTYVITAEGPKAITSMGANWPQKRIKIQGGALARPDILVREG